jgi:hypothetical protein
MARLATVLGIALAATAAGCITPDGYYRPDGGGTASGGASAQGGASGASGAAGVNGTGGAAGGAVGTGGSAVGTGGSAVGGKGGTGALGGATGQGGSVVGTGGAVAPTGAGGTTACVPTIALPYSEDFESDTVGMPPSAQKWIQDTIDSDASNGTFMVVSDGGSKVLQGVANSSSWITDIGGDQCWTNYTFQVDIKLISGSSYEFGLWGRFDIDSSINKGTYYTAYMDDTGAVQLRLRQNGSTTTLGTKSKSTTGSPVVGTVYTFVLDMHGNTLSVSVNGTPRVSMVMDATLTTGAIGLAVASGTVEFDNVKVTQ